MQNVTHFSKIPHFMCICVEHVVFSFMLSNGNAANAPQDFFMLDGMFAAFSNWATCVHETLIFIKNSAAAARGRL